MLTPYFAGWSHTWQTQVAYLDLVLCDDVVDRQEGLPNKNLLKTLLKT